MLRVKLPVVDTILPESNKFVTGMGSKVTDVSKLNVSPAGRSFWPNLHNLLLVFLNKIISKEPCCAVRNTAFTFTIYGWEGGGRGTHCPHPTCN